MSLHVFSTPASRSSHSGSACVTATRSGVLAILMFKQGVVFWQCCVSIGASSLVTNSTLQAVSVELYTSMAKLRVIYTHPRSWRGAALLSAFGAYRIHSQCTATKVKVRFGKFPQGGGSGSCSGPVKGG